MLIKYIYSLCVCDSNYIETIEAHNIDEAQHDVLNYVSLHLPINYVYVDYTKLKQDLINNGVIISELFQINEL